MVECVYRKKIVDRSLSAEQSHHRSAIYIYYNRLIRVINKIFADNQQHFGSDSVRQLTRLEGSFRVILLKLSLKKNKHRVIEKN